MFGCEDLDAAADELTRPLGQNPERAGAAVLRRGTVVTAMIVAGCAIAAAFGGAALYGDPHGGRPLVRSEIAARPDRPMAVEHQAGAPPSGDPARRDAAAVEAASGVSIVRGDGSAAPSSLVVSIPDIPGHNLLSAPDPRVSERTRNGVLPRIGADGSRPLAIYARPAGELAGGGRPVGRVAIVIGGLGISRSATDEAIARLPPAVSLAFAPYGPDLDRLTERARAAGHEILLQVPMEPFDFPDSDPGPHTLLTSAKPAENLDHLQWAMGRFSGYVGILNYMGAKLTADERALAPVLREIGARGLGMVDDGSSSRSRIAALAGDTRAARADVVLDAVPRADLIDKALERLEALAGSSGRIVIASASALPVTTDRIARWAQAAEARGILVVPISVGLLGATSQAGPGREHGPAGEVERR